MPKTCALIGGLLAAAVLAPVPAARAATSWIVGDTSTIWDYTPGFGLSNQRFVITPFHQLDGIEHVNGVNYLYIHDWAGNGDLFTESAGVVTLAMANVTPGYGSEGDMSYNPVDGDFYFLNTVATYGQSTVWRTNLALQTTTLLCTLVDYDPSGLAFDNQGRCFTIDSGWGTTGQTTLRQVNLATGAVLSATNLFQTVGAVVGLDFDPTTNEMYLSLADGTFGRVNNYLTSPSFQALDNNGVYNCNLAYVVPAPGACVLLGLGMMPVRRSRRRGGR